MFCHCGTSTSDYSCGHGVRVGPTRVVSSDSVNVWIRFSIRPLMTYTGRQRDCAEKFLSKGLAFWRVCEEWEGVFLLNCLSFIISFSVHVVCFESYVHIKLLFFLYSDLAIYDLINFKCSASLLSSMVERSTHNSEVGCSIQPGGLWCTRWRTWSVIFCTFPRLQKLLTTAMHTVTEFVRHFRCFLTCEGVQGMTDYVCHCVCRHVGHMCMGRTKSVIFSLWYVGV